MSSTNRARHRAHAAAAQAAETQRRERRLDRPRQRRFWRGHRQRRLRQRLGGHDGVHAGEYRRGSSPGSQGGVAGRQTSMDGPPAPDFSKGGGG